MKGSTTAPVPSGVTICPVESTQDLYSAVTGQAPGMDVIIQAAAPADYRFEQRFDQKLKKQKGEPLTVTLVENPDVAKAVGEAKQPGQVLVGFAAETENLLENAQKKRKSKHLDLVVANDVTKPGAGFNTDTNIAALISDDGIEELPLMSKRELADRILDKVLQLRGIAQD